MSFTEQAIIFPCAGEQLLGILAVPENLGKSGVLIVVGGPQYRVGSHRQFLLLSRVLAEADYPTMRFDYRGMGDSTGELRDFEAVNEDIGAAIDAFQSNCPQLERIVLWGLCDAASAILLYWGATQDVRVSGLVLLNPWVRSEATLARAHIKHYYGQRLYQADFWRKLLTGNLGVGKAIFGFIGSLKSARKDGDPNAKLAMQSFQKKMLCGLQNFREPVLLLLSGNDYTAKEFLEAVHSEPAWVTILKQPQFNRIDIPDADHTFSSAQCRREVESHTVNWLDHFQK